MNRNLLEMQYAVRGTVVIAADEITSNIAAAKENGKPSPYSFDKIIYTNIGNPHSVGQKPLTFPRQVMALVDLPDEVGVDHPEASTLFPTDAITRAKEIKDALGGCGTGAYSHSQGALGFRKDISTFIENRDSGLHSNPEDLFMTNGASSAINMLLNCLIQNQGVDGCMIPIPQYPIYSATLELLGGVQIGYNLDEQDGWTASTEELERSLQEAKDNGKEVKAFVLINPGNPTGQVLSKEAVMDVCRFCVKHRLVLLADEVYQENVYVKGKTFISAKKAAADAGVLDDLELVSFHSTSKGLFGECGRRGGYMELCGIDPAVKAELYKLASSGLCSGLPGQVMTSLMVNEPKPGDTSYNAHKKEKDEIFSSLKDRAQMVVKGLNSIEGFNCQEAEGSMYCFPNIQIPEKAVKDAEKLGMSPDTLYAVSLLEETGICVVPASGFKQAPGRYGFRTTFLPPKHEMEMAIDKFSSHYKGFMAKYA